MYTLYDVNKQNDHSHSKYRSLSKSLGTAEQISVNEDNIYLHESVEKFVLHTSFNFALAIWV